MLELEGSSLISQLSVRLPLFCIVFSKKFLAWYSCSLIYSWAVSFLPFSPSGEFFNCKNYLPLARSCLHTLSLFCMCRCLSATKNINCTYFTRESPFIEIVISLPWCWFFLRGVWTLVINKSDLSIPDNLGSYSPHCRGWSGRNSSLRADPPCAAAWLKVRHEAFVGHFPHLYVMVMIGLSDVSKNFVFLLPLHNWEINGHILWECQIKTQHIKRYFFFLQKLLCKKDTSCCQIYKELIYFKSACRYEIRLQIIIENILF